MAFRWWADDGPTALNADLVALCCLETLQICDFRGGVRTPCPPQDPRMGNSKGANQTALMRRLVRTFVVCLLKCQFFSSRWPYVLRKTIEGYLDSVPSLTSNTIKTLLIMHALYSSRHLQSK